MQRPVYSGMFFYDHYYGLFPGGYSSDCDSGEDCEDPCITHYHDSGYHRKKVAEISKDYDIREAWLKWMINDQPEYYVVKMFKILCVNQTFKSSKIINFLAHHGFPSYEKREDSSDDSSEDDLFARSYLNSSSDSEIEKIL